MPQSILEKTVHFWFKKKIISFVYCYAKAFWTRDEYINDFNINISLMQIYG